MDQKNLKRIVKQLHTEMNKIPVAFQSQKEQMEAFMFVLKSAITDNDRNKQAGYFEGVDNNALENRRSDVLKKTGELETLTEWSEFLQSAITDAQNAIKQNQQREILYYSTYLRALVNYLLSVESNMRKCMAIIRDCNAELCARIEEAYKQAEKSLKEYIRPARRRAVTIPPVSEEVEVPKKFPEEAKLYIGKYSEGFDVEDGYPAHDESQLQNVELKAFIEELQSRLNKCELNYKKLIYSLVSASRTEDAFSLDFSSVNEDCHIAIHQPVYSETENRDKPVVELLEAAIYRFMGMFPKTSKRMALIQKRAFSELAPFVRNIATEKNRYLVFTIDEKSDDVVYGNAETFLRALSSECDTVSDMLERTECRNLFEYNRLNYQNGVWKQLTLFIVKDFPLGFNDQSLKDFKALLSKANRFGIYVLMTVCDDLLEEMKTHDKTADFDGILDYFSESFNLCAENGDYTYSMISRNTYEKVYFGDYVLKRETFRREKYFTDFERKMANANDPAIPLQSLFEGGLENTEIPQDERREKFFKILRFPIGKEGTMPRFMELHQSGGGSPHVVIAGTTGSGKSVLLQDIILSAMCCYTPEELEIYLFDFKATAGGFDIYQSHFFPHVKKIATECKEKEITELLEMIRKSYRSRMEYVKNFRELHPEVSNISEYNAYARKNGLRQIPRMMVVIDEYQTITSEENISILLEIAQKGREYGVVLIMASQSSNVSSFGNIIKLFGHRFEFKNEPIGSLIFKASSRAQELSGPHGLCFYSPNGSALNPFLVRCAFVREDKDLPEFISYIAKKYAAYPATTYKIGSIKREDIIRPAEYDKDSGFISLEKIAQSGGRVFDGEEEGYNEWLEAAARKVTGGGDMQNAGYILDIGLNSISLAPVRYKLDKKSPYMLAYGDSFRIESLFYSAAKSIIEATAKAGKPLEKPIVYYFNGNKKPREDSPVMAFDFATRAVELCTSETRAKEAVNALYAEFESRKNSANALCTPIVVMVSEFISFIDAFGLDKKTDVKTSVAVIDQEVKSARTQGFASKFGSLSNNWGKPANEGQAQSAQSQPQTVAQEASKAPEKQEAKTQNDKTFAEKFNTLLSAEGGRYGFFFCLQISDSSKNNYLKKNIELSKIDSVVYLDTCEEGENGNINQVGAFTSVFLPNRRVKISTQDIKSAYAYTLTDDKTAEFIPYEYKLQ